MTEELIDVLESWHEKILVLVAKFGLNCFPQDFEICDYEQMIGYEAYSGMPSHYPHWSYGKSFERTRTLYDLGVTGLPYEMVINASPAIAYLMKDNSLLLQILTMAHVYGHNDFFKNNFTFKSTFPELTVERFKVHADRIRKYIEDPYIGEEKVESFLDAAHSLALQCQRNLATRKLDRKEQEEWAEAELSQRYDPFQRIHQRKAVDEEAIKKMKRRVPIEPDEDILLFIRDHNPHLAEWEQDILTIVTEEAQYFIPQIETKIMNEGWASFWHKKIIEALDLPQGMRLEFAQKHSQVVAKHLGRLNPYYLGLTVWEDIMHRYDETLSGKICEEHLQDYERNGEPGDLRKGKTGFQKIFEVREVDRDSSFLRQYLTEHVIREMDLFEHKAEGGGRVVSNVADERGWKQIRETLVGDVGMGSVPVIKVEDADYNNNRLLYLKHNYDGRELYGEFAERTLKFVCALWGRGVALETVVNGSKILLTIENPNVTVSSRRL